MKRRKGRVFLLLGALLLSGALGLTAHNRMLSHRAGKKAADVLERLVLIRGDAAAKAEPIASNLAAQPAQTNHAPAPMLCREDYPAGESEIEIPDYLLDPERDMPAKEIDGAAYVGTLSFPSLGLELPVASSYSEELLRTTPCLYAGSAYRDNIVICAHKYTVHFGKIGTLPADSEVVFTDMDGNRFLYRVDNMELIRPAGVMEMTESGYALSLFTCTLDGQNRLTVRCVRSDRS